MNGKDSLTIDVLYEIANNVTLNNKLVIPDDKRWLLFYIFIHGYISSCFLEAHSVHEPS